MANQPLTEEQQARRAATARANGAKSRGPKTANGKYISSLNSIVTGEHLGKHEADVPGFLIALPEPDKNRYRQLLQNNVRHMQPRSEAELDAVRYLSLHQFQLHRLERIEENLRQIHHGEMLGRYPDFDYLDHECGAYKSGIEDEKVWRALNRDRRSHEGSIRHYRREFQQLRKHCPLAVPEPVSVTHEMQPPDPDPLPAPAVVSEALDHAARQQSEPSYQPPFWIANILDNKDLVERIAKRDNRKIVNGRLELPKLPRAA
ncbi:MAG: hypothetical protein ACK6D7_25275 [Acidobacteriota bacterium]